MPKNKTFQPTKTVSEGTYAIDLAKILPERTTTPVKRKPMRGSFEDATNSLAARRLPKQKA